MRFTKIISVTIPILVLMGCSSSYVTKKLIRSSDSLHHHTGFVLYDPVKKKSLISVHGDKYFTPASNTKIFTLYAGLKMLGDSVPALRWINRNDSLIFWGTGDPSFLYTEVFQNKRTYDFLKSASGKLCFSSSNYFENAFGPGWSWADYPEYYQAERSPFPVYGNLASASKQQNIHPPVFQTKVNYTTDGDEGLNRDQFSNTFIINKSKLPETGSSVVPFITNDTLTVKLLADTLKLMVARVTTSLPPNAGFIYSIPMDSLYKVMMQTSDNYVAEQILLMCAQKISDSLKTRIAINKMVNGFLSDLPDAPIWRDGSGLSRYNQFTPRSIVALWEKMYQEIPQDRLFPLLVSNGKKGTLRNMLSNQPTFIFGKTGSLANNYCLSGYLVTRKKHLLIFSSMNADFVVPVKSVRDNLAKTLLYIYEHY